MNKENKHHDHHESAKHLAYAGLATATLVGGLGGAPIVLAKEINNERTELATKGNSTETPVVTVPDALPNGDLKNTQKLPATPKSPKTISSKATTKTQEKNSRAFTEPHTFVRSDFYIQNGTLYGYSVSFYQSNVWQTWDGVLNITNSNHELDDVTQIASGAFSGSEGYPPIASFTLANLPNLSYMGNWIVYGSEALTDVTFSNLPKLTTTGGSTFEDCINLKNVTFDRLPALTEIKSTCFRNTGLTQIDLTPLKALQHIDFRAFSNCTQLESVNVTGLTNLDTIDGEAFASTAIHDFDFSTLTGLKVIQAYAFYDCQNLTEITIANSPQLERIADHAFYNCQNLESVKLLNNSFLLGWGWEESTFQNCTKLTNFQTSGLNGITFIYGYNFDNTPLASLDLSKMPNLNYIADFSFSNMPNLEELTVGKLTSGLSIQPNAFSDMNNAGEIIPTGEDALVTAKRIRDNINTVNSLTSRDDVWYINSDVTFNYVDQQNNPIASNTNPTTATRRIGDKFTLANAPTINGYTATELVGGPVTLNHLAQELTYKYQENLAPAFTISYVDIHGNPITNSATESGVIDNEFVDGHYANDAFNLPQETLDDDPDLANYVFKELQRSNDNGGWDTISMNNLPATYGANDGHNYRFVYSELSTVTQSYIDEAGNQITVADHHTIRDEDDANYDYTFAADTADFYANGAPKIDGYDEPVVTDDSAPVTGKIIGDAQQVVIYQYKTIAKSGTIYRVDTDGNELAAPETFSGHINDVLDLKAKQQTFAGYELKELYSGTPSVAKKILGVTAYNWEAAHALIGTTLKYGDNDGQSYKFEYVKKVTDDTKQPAKTPAATPQTPGDLPTTGGDKTPTNTPVTTPDKNKTPGDGKLPGTGGDTPINTTNITTVTKNTSDNSATDKDTDLPQSGNIANYMIPALGATLMAGLIGLYAFAKKRKN